MALTGRLQTTPQLTGIIDVLAVKQRRQLFDRVQLLSGLFQLTLCGQQFGGQSGRGGRQLLAAV